MARPRTTSFSDEEMIALGEEMIEYLRTHDIVHLKEWYSIEKSFLHEEWKCFIQIPSFLPYYQKAISMISMKYVREDTGIEPSLKHRFLRLYFGDIREREDQDKDEDTVRKTKVSQADSETEVKKFREFLNETRGHCEGVPGTLRPEMETQQPILDQGQPGAEGQV